MNGDHQSHNSATQSTLQLFEFAAKFHLSHVTEIAPLFVKSPVLAYGSYKHFYPSEEKVCDRLMAYIADLYDLWAAGQRGGSLDDSIGRFLALASLALNRAFDDVSMLPEARHLTREGLETWMQHQ